MYIYIFTNVLLSGTINIVSNFLFPNPTSTFPSFSRKCFQDLLNLAVSNSFLFLLNGQFFKQVESLGMGLPLSLYSGKYFHVIP